MKQSFKVGDLVYFPRLNNKSHKLVKNGENSTYQLRIKGYSYSFTKDGKELSDDTYSSIFHVTKENSELLSKLYGDNFNYEEPFLDKHLALGSKVLCLVCLDPSSKLPNKIWELKSNMLIDLIVKNEHGAYINQHNLIIKGDNIIYPISVDSNGNIKYLK